MTEPWVTDFCRRPRILVMLGMAELVVVLVALWPDEQGRLTLAQFLSASAFSMWLALAVAVLLCKLRRPLSRLTPRFGALSALVLAGLVALFAAGVVYGLYTALGESSIDVGFWRFVCGSAAIAVLITAFLLRYFYVSDRWVAQLNANARAQADALQARIRPHFLFNSLNSISALAGSRPEEARKMIHQLSDFFRGTMKKDDQQLITLAEELEHLTLYLEIEKVRFAHRLKTEIEYDETAPMLKLPSLLLHWLHLLSRNQKGRQNPPLLIAHQCIDAASIHSVLRILK